MIARDRTVRFARWSILVAISVLALKLFAWWLTGSVALFSDALESIVNVVAALIAWWAVHVSTKPADDDHHFGHYKAEYLSAVFEGALIIVAALLIFREALDSILQPHIIEFQGVGMAVNALAALLNFLWARQLTRIGTLERSPALLADARHLRADVITSAGVLIGLLLILLTGWQVLDAIIAILVGINILIEGWRVVSHSMDGLMDGTVSIEDRERIQAAILASAGGAIEVHDIRTRRAGAVCFAEFHLVVDGGMSVAESHSICDRIEDALLRSLPGVQIIIHVEPGNKVKPGALRIG